MSGQDAHKGGALSLGSYVISIGIAAEALERIRNYFPVQRTLGVKIKSMKIP